MKTCKSSYWEGFPETLTSSEVKNKRPESHLSTGGQSSLNVAV